MKDNPLSVATVLKHSLYAPLLLEAASWKALTKPIVTLVLAAFFSAATRHFKMGYVLQWVALGTIFVMILWLGWEFERHLVLGAQGCKTTSLRQRYGAYALPITIGGLLLVTGIILLPYRAFYVIPFFIAFIGYQGANVFSSSQWSAGNQDFLYAAGSVLGAGIILCAVGFVWMLLVRISLLFPAAAAGHRVAPIRIWRLTRGNSLRLFLLLVVLPVGFNIALQMGLAFGPGASSWRSLFLTLLGIYEYLVFLAILAFSYRKLSDVVFMGSNCVGEANLLSDTARKKVYALICILSIIFAGVTVWNATLQIAPGEAVQIVRSGIPNRIESGPGVHFKLPFLEKSQPLPETYAFDMTDVCRTRNKQSLEIGFNVQWEIIDMAAFTRTSAGVRNAQSHITDYFSGILRSRIATADGDQIDHLQKVDTAKQQKNDETNQDSPIGGLIEDVNKRIEVFGIKISSLQVKTVTILN